MLDLLDELGIADDTIVIYSTDNGPHMNSWPDGGMTPFRSEKNTNWEGAFRVRTDPLARRRSRGHGSERDQPATRLVADVPGRRRRARHHRETQEGPQGWQQDLQGALDGYNLLPYLTGAANEEPAARASSTSPTTAT